MPLIIIMSAHNTAQTTCLYEYKMYMQTFLAAVVGFICVTDCTTVGHTCTETMY